jgi:DNA-binding protein Fis
MKRIVTLVLPVDPNEGAENASHGSAASSAVAALEPLNAVAGAVRLETVVTDEFASHILTELFEQAMGSPPTKSALQSERARNWEEFIRRELDSSDPADNDILERFVAELERQVISQVYTRCDNVKYRAAAKLGINRNTLVKRLRQFGEEIEDELDEDAIGSRPK